jgi:hypothetical protein
MKNKKVILAFAVFAWLSCAGALADSAHAFGIRAGPYVWFAWWFPAFQDWMLKSSLTERQLPRIRKEFYFNPSLLYGPVLTFDISNNINISSVFIMGKYRLRATIIESLYNLAYIVSHPDIGIYKYDLDSTLNISLHKNLKIFLGFKYQNYDYAKVDLIQVSAPSACFYGHDEVHYNGLSGGMGVGINLALQKNLHIYWNVSVLYQRPVIRIRQNRYLLLPPNIVPLKKKIIPAYNSVGGNLSIALGYHVDPISTTLLLGFRYQFIYTIGKDRRGFNLDKKWDHFDGVTLAAIYSYQMVKSKDAE